MYSKMDIYHLHLSIFNSHSQGLPNMGMCHEKMNAMIENLYLAILICKKFPYLALT